MCSSVHLMAFTAAESISRTAEGAFRPNFRPKTRRVINSVRNLVELNRRDLLLILDSFDITNLCTQLICQRSQPTNY